jgi:Rrf2 family iron-sulfur cluster assembly transcriptional regulator
MRLTTKGRFAVTAMIDLGHAPSARPVTLAGISERQRISLSYLEQLFGRLRRQGIVDSVRGPGGGYTLARAHGEISVADIIRAVDEPIDATQCGGLGNCHDDRECMTHDLWMSLNSRIYDYLDSVHLDELVQQAAGQTRPMARRPQARNPPRGGLGATEGRGAQDGFKGLMEQEDGQDPHLPDYSATTPVDPRVAAKMIPYLTEMFGNPASRVRMCSAGTPTRRWKRRAATSPRWSTPIPRKSSGPPARPNPTTWPSRARALLSWQGQAPDHGQDRAQGGAGYLPRTGARRLRSHLPGRAGQRPDRSGRTQGGHASGHHPGFRDVS